MSYRYISHVSAGFLIALFLPMLRAAEAAIDAAVYIVHACLRADYGTMWHSLQSVGLIAFKVIDRLKPEYDASYQSHGCSIDLCSRC